MSSTHSTKPGLLNLTFWIAAVLAPAMACYTILFRKILSIPCEDDYTAILGFSLEHLSLPTRSARVLHILSAQHNDYKLILEHVILVAELAFTHHISFVFLQVLGDLFLIGILALLFLLSFTSEPLIRRLQLFLPISLVVCSLNDFAVTNFAMSTIQNLGIHFFVLLTLYLLVRSSRSFAFACIAAALACCSSANGFLLGPIGLFLIWPRRSTKQIAAWCATFAFALAAYLYGYQHHPGPPVKAFYYVPVFFFSFLGSAIQNRWAAAPFGFVLAALAVIATRQRFDRHNPSLFYFMLFLLGTAGLAAAGRAGSGLFNSVASRYQINSNLLLVALYVFLAHRYLQRTGKPLLHSLTWLTAIALALCFCIVGDRSGALGLDDRNSELLTGLSNYRRDPNLNSPMYFNDPEIQRGMQSMDEPARILMTRSIRAGIYTPPTP